MSNSLDNAKYAIYDAYSQELNENVELRDKIEAAFYELELGAQEFISGINQHYFSDIDTPPIWVALQ